MRDAMHVDKQRISISDPEQYDKIEIRNLTYKDESTAEDGYNGNVIIGYNKDSKDVFYLSINHIEEADLDNICDKIEEMFGQEDHIMNLMIYNGDSIIYNLSNE